MELPKEITTKTLPSLHCKNCRLFSRSRRGWCQKWKRKVKADGIACGAIRIREEACEKSG